MDEQERQDYGQAGKMEREEYVQKNGQKLVEELQDMLEPKLKNYKEQFISSVNHVFDK